MSNSQDHKSLSKMELLVLARCASKDGAKPDEIENVVAKFAAGNGQSASEALAGLRRRSLVTASGSRVRLTPAGRGVLCTALSVEEAPTWTAVQHRCLARLGLAATPETKKPGARAAARRSTKIDAQTFAALRQRLQMTNAKSLSALCDALLAKALGFSGKVTLAALHAHILARSLEIDVPAGASREEVARLGANQPQGNGSHGKRAAQQPLGFHDAQPAGKLWSISTAPALGTVPSAHTATPPGAIAVGTSVPPRTPPRPPNVVEGDRLLNLVREAIPRIGSDGRFGPEKVFVSALWHYLEDDGRLPDLSLERFKGWLVTANRDQLVDLVRADSQGDMDGRLLEESEIRDLGATFHFVIDRQMSGSRRGYHAR